MKKWYGLLIDGELMRVKSFNDNAVPNINTYDGIAKDWEIPFSAVSKYEMVKLDELNWVVIQTALPAQG